MNISIIIPVYNVEDFLQECVDSVLLQDYADFELILVDDGSTDRSGIICDEIAKGDCRIKVYHKKNGGLSDARNFGIAKATGSYLTFIDSDDFILPSYLSKLMNLVDKYNADVSCVQFYSSNNRDDIPVNDRVESGRVPGEEAVADSLLRQLFGVSACGKLYRKNLFNGVRFPVGELFEDLLTIPYIFEKCVYVAYTTEKLYFYYDRVGSITHSRITEKHMMIIDNTIGLIRHIDTYCPSAHQAAVVRLCIESIKRLVDILLISGGYFSRIRTIKEKCSGYWKEGLRSSLLPRSIKIQISMIICSPLLYWLLFTLYKKKQAQRN